MAGGAIHQVMGVLHATAGGPNAYYYSHAQGSGTPADTYSGNVYVLWAAITVATGGTATEIGAYCSAFGSASNIKLALYDSLGIAQATPAAVAVSATGWINATISAAVSAGTVYVGWICDTSNVAFERATLAADVGRSSDTPYTYASGMPATLPANLNPPGGQPTVRVFVS